MYILSIRLCAFQAIAARIHSCPCLFVFNYPCNSHQRLLISWVSLMQMMLIWAFMIIHSSFINEVFTTARLQRLLMRELEVLTLTGSQRKLWLPVLDGHLCLRTGVQLAAPASSSDSWAYHLFITTYCRWELNLFCVCFIWWARTRESSLTCSQFPSKAQGCAGAV